MAACRFGSPDLVYSLAGAAASPTFAFDATNVNHFGLSGSFTSVGNGGVCSFPTRFVGSGRTSTYAITPMIVTGSGRSARTTTCNLLAPPSVNRWSASTTYDGIDCPAITNNAFAAGTYTLKFSQPEVNGAPSIPSRVFVITSPTVSTSRITVTTTRTTGVSAVPSSTTTATGYSSTVTVTPAPSPDTTTTVALSDSAETTATVTDFPSSCSEMPASMSPASLPSSISLDGSCGETSGQTCLGSEFGNCCSMYGYCGSIDIYCKVSEGCQSQFGDCDAAAAVSESLISTDSVSSGNSPTPTSSLSSISLDGSCGGTTGQICQGSRYGDCCSMYGYCGSSNIYCAVSEGCQSEFGVCDGAAALSGSPISGDSTDAGPTPAPTSLTTTGTPSNDSTSSNLMAVESTSTRLVPSDSTPSGTTPSVAVRPDPTVTLFSDRLSPDGTCGGDNGHVCQGSGFGDCCSSYGWCGSSMLHCETGCQTPFGICTPASLPQSSTLATITTLDTSQSSSSDSLTLPSNDIPISISPSIISAAASDSDIPALASNNISVSASFSVTSVATPNDISESVSVSDTATQASSDIPASASASFSDSPISGIQVSSDGRCGGINSQTCFGTSFGNCCSEYGWCGSTDAHCGSGCQSGFGACTNTTTVKRFNRHKRYAGLYRDPRRGYKRAVSGVGPDYTYPPVPRTTFTTTSTRIVWGGATMSGVITNTVLGVFTTTLARVEGSVITIFESGKVMPTATVTLTATVCPGQVSSAPIS